MSEHPESQNGVVHPSVKYESTDLSLRAILTFSAALVGALAVVVAGLFLMVWMFLGTPPQPEPVERWDFKGEPGPNPNSSYLPAKPELEAIDQNTPPSEGGRANTRPNREQVKDEEDHLKGFGWADEKKGIVYIPIKRTMEQLGGKPGAAGATGRQTPGGAP